MTTSLHRGIIRALHVVAFAIAPVAFAPALVAQPVRVGAVAPKIDLPILSGGRFQLSEQRGRPVIVSFWGTWCPPCREEFPELVRLHGAHSATSLVVLGVNGRDQERRTTDVQKFVDEFRVPFPIALDQRGKTRQAYRLFGLPTTVFIDTAGVIRRIHTGPISREQLDSGTALILPAR